jgi:hypothetical protein
VSLWASALPAKPAHNKSETLANAPTAVLMALDPLRCLFESKTYEDWHSCASRMIHDLGHALRDHQCVAAAVALRVNLTFMGSLERAITNTGLFLPVVQLPVS